MIKRNSPVVSTNIVMVLLAFLGGCEAVPEEATGPIPQPEPEFLLFAIIDPSVRIFSGYAIGADVADSALEPARHGYDMARVGADGVELDGRHIITMDDHRSTYAGWMFFLGDDPVHSATEFQTSVLASGEGDAMYRYVSMADAMTYELRSLCFGCGSVLERQSQDYYIFGSEYPVPTSGAEMTFEGVWRGNFIREVDGVIEPGAIKVRGAAFLSIAPDTGTVSGRLTPTHIVSGTTGSTVDLNMSDVVLSGTTSTGSILGAAEVTLDYVSPDDRLLGTFEGSLFGSPPSSEIGGVISLSEDYSHVGGTDPNEVLDISLIGAFVGR